MSKSTDTVNNHASTPATEAIFRPLTAPDLAATIRAYITDPVTPAPVRRPIRHTTTAGNQLAHTQHPAAA